MSRLVIEARRTGYIPDIAAGIQFNINVARKRAGDKIIDGPVCDHNCQIVTMLEGLPVRTGNYNCGSSNRLPENKGFRVGEMADVDFIVGSFARLLAGIRTYNRDHLRGRALESYQREFRIPQEVAAEQLRNLEEGRSVEGNIFGGNPELHPEVGKIIGGLKDLGLLVTMTTTGGKFLRGRGEVFFEKVVEAGLAKLAVSGDDFENMEHFQALSGMTIEQLRAVRIASHLGQQKKAVEAMATANLVTKYGKLAPRMVINVVAHPGNLHFIEELGCGWKEKVPTAQVNIFPAQSSFEHASKRKPVFGPDHREQLVAMVDRRLENHRVENIAGEVPRIQYYLALRAALDVYTNPDQSAEAMSGQGVWQCYREHAGAYAQAGMFAEPYEVDSRNPGGFMSCYWDEPKRTVTDRRKQIILMEAHELAEHFNEGMVNIARSTLESERCPGCVMPRLMFDGRTTEAGLVPMLHEAYLKRRMEYLNF